MSDSSKKYIITLKGKSFEVPPGGSLGVLALGNVGVRAWKKAKKEWDNKSKNSEEEK